MRVGIGLNVGANEKASAALVSGLAGVQKDALGRDYNGDGRGIGYNVQSLLGVAMVQPYMHNGACESLACVVRDVKHRTGNFTITDFLDTPQKRNELTTFLESIDADTQIVP